MSLLDVLRTGVRIADNVTKSVQGDVTFERHLSTDAFGTKTYGGPIVMKAIVDYTRRQVRTSSGVMSLSRATVMFLNIGDVVLATSGDGIDDNDRITLPDGTTGPILKIDGFVDSVTTHPLASEVMLG